MAKRLAAHREGLDSLMAGEGARRVFKHSRPRRLLSGLGLFGGAGWFGWLCVTGADVQARGWDFRETHVRVVGLLLALAPLTCGAEYLVRLARDVPDIEVNEDGLLVRRLFFQPKRFVRWADVTSIREGSVAYGFSSLPVLYVNSARTSITLHLHGYAEPPSEVARTVVNACLPAAGPDLELVVKLPSPAEAESPPAAQEIKAGAHAFAEGSVDIRELWEIVHRNIVTLVAVGPLDGDYRELLLGLRAWEHAEGAERDAATARTRTIARRLGRSPAQDS